MGESTKEEREEGEGTDDDDDDDDDDDQDNSKDEEEEEEEDDENPYVSQIKRNAQLDYRGRYLTRPQDYLVICMAMISQHSDLDAGDREMANVWIRIWDDASNSYKELIKRGYDYTEL